LATLLSSNHVPDIASFENVTPHGLDTMYSIDRDLPTRGIFVTHNAQDPDFREVAFNASPLNPPCAALCADNEQVESGHPAGPVVVWSGECDTMAPEAVLDLLLCPTWLPSGLVANQQVDFS
jgi:hypothetical protein